MKTSNLCMPRFKGNNKTKRLSPMTLFERFREAIFRLIMLSALTKTSSDQHFNSLAVPQRYYHQPDDARRSEDMADCIEFIKRKAFIGENRESSDRNSTANDVIGDVAMQVL
ncbi:hypothetical protein Golob_022510 [Gossypium lobatum]|uniref:Josephin-like protein n=2 Tax=Gossypium TaxID=3633 RepID=A0A7J8WRV3_GOSAI|nr:hypothetical protein [Gossypium lobatum]MBA0677620.1 hypothetical protein [Gossypium aridum]